MTMTCICWSYTKLCWTDCSAHTGSHMHTIVHGVCMQRVAFYFNVGPEFCLKVISVKTLPITMFESRKAHCTAVMCAPDICKRQQ